MTMDQTKDNAPSSRTAGKRRGGVVPEAKASGAEVSAPSPSSSSCDDTRPFPPRTAGGGIKGKVPARSPEWPEGHIAPGEIRLGPEVVLLPAGMKLPIAPGIGTMDGGSRDAPAGGQEHLSKRKRKEGEESSRAEETELDTSPEAEATVIRRKSSTDSRILDVREYISKVREGRGDYRKEIWSWTEVFLEVEEELELVRKDGWESVKREGIQSWTDWVESVQWEISRLHSLGVDIMVKEGRRKKELRNEYRKMREDRGLMRERWRVSELELEVARKRVEWLEGEVERRKNGMEGNEEEKGRGETDMERMGGWEEMEKRVEECVRRVMREERGKMAELDREVGRMEERVVRAEQYMREEMRGGGELEGRIGKSRIGTGRVGDTDNGNRDNGGTRTGGAGEKKNRDAEVEVPAPPLPALIEIRGGPGVTYAGALTKVKEKVSLRRHGVRDVVVRATPKGTALIIVKGEKCREKAKDLAREMREVLGKEGMVTCPRRMAEVEVAGFDPSASAPELRSALTSAGGFPEEDLSLGAIRRTRGGAGRVWARIPRDAVAPLVEKGVPIGWTRGRVYRLDDRPVQCLRCWGFGHIGAHCREEAGWRKTPLGCFRCGKGGHIARGCTASPSCQACAVRGWEAAHRMGGPTCRALQEAKGRGVEPPQAGRTSNNGKEGVDCLQEENLDPGERLTRMEVEEGVVGSPERGAAPLESPPGRDEVGEEEQFFSPLPQRTVKQQEAVPLSEGSGDVPPRGGELPQQQMRDFAPVGE